MNSLTLNGKIILVTGATQGIGKAVSVNCALAGATVIACGRNVRALELLSDSIVKQGGATPSLLPINLATASVKDYREIASHILNQYSHLDGAILNAAMLGELTPISNYLSSMWMEVFQVNVHANFLMLKELRELLLKSKMKSVLFTLENAKVTHGAHWGAYGASKAALQALMKVFALENTAADELNVIGVIPPPTRTSIRMSAYPAEDQSKLADPIAVADAYVGLLTTAKEHLMQDIFDISYSK